tara:strand:- start:374 stop:640 length:267 start_codon:yes stop_codon:yes gene_type:complete
MARLTAGTAYRPIMGDGSRGVVHVIIGDNETVTLSGSVAGATYTTIETFSSTAIKEVVLTPYMKFTATDGDNAGSVASTVDIDETRGK